MHLEIPKIDSTRPVVLCLASLQFVRDVDALSKWSTRYTFAAISDAFLTETQERWIPPQLQEQAFYVNETSPEIEAAWAKSKRFGLGILQQLLLAGAKIAAVMAGNWDYWNEECIRLACAEMGIPFLVLMREHDLTANRWKDGMEFWGALQRIPDVAGVAFAGNASLHLVAELGLFPRSKLRVTGWPRLDLWRRPAVPMLDHPVVLMSYFRGYNADQHFVEVMKLFAALARRYPQVPFIVKAKNHVDLAILQKVSDARGFGLTILDTVNFPSLLSNARAVIGFMSVTMYEALLSPARIMIPRWGQTDIDPRLLAPSPMDERLHGHMEFFKSPEDLVHGIEACIDGAPPPVDRDGRRRLFGEYFAFTPDRTAVEMVEDFVEEFALKVPIALTPDAITQS